MPTPKTKQTSITLNMDPEGAVRTMLVATHLEVPDADDPEGDPFTKDVRVNCAEFTDAEKGKLAAFQKVAADIASRTSGT